MWIKTENGEGIWRKNDGKGISKCYHPLMALCGNFYGAFVVMHVK